MNTGTKRLLARAESTVLTVFLALGLTPLATLAQTNDSTAAQVAAAVLPLPDAMRSGATVVIQEGPDKYSVIRKGSNEMVCIREPIDGAGGRAASAYPAGTQIFWAHCYHEAIFSVMKRSAELRQEFLKGGKTVDAKMVNDAIDGEIKAGKLKLPDHPTMGFQMREPLTGYNQAKNSVSPEIQAWQMVIIPYSTGASLSLPEMRTSGMPWVMSSGTWISHIMIAPVQTTATAMPH